MKRSSYIIFANVKLAHLVVAGFLAMAPLLQADWQLSGNLWLLDEDLAGNSLTPGARDPGSAALQIDPGFNAYSTIGNNWNLTLEDPVGINLEGFNTSLTLFGNLNITTDNGNPFFQTAVLFSNNSTLTGTGNISIESFGTDLTQANFFTAGVIAQDLLIMPLYYGAIDVTNDNSGVDPVGSTGINSVLWIAYRQCRSGC